LSNCRTRLRVTTVKTILSLLPSTGVELLRIPDCPVRQF
jgi:hypothetical protein